MPDKLDNMFDMQEFLANVIFEKRKIVDRNGGRLTCAKIAQSVLAGDMSAQGLGNEWGIKMIEAMEHELEELKELFPWKHWTTDEIGQRVHPNESQEERRQHVIIELIDMQHFLMEMLIFMGATADDVFEAYKRKWEANKARQDNGYNTSTKTEADNNKIASELAKQ